MTTTTRKRTGHVLGRCKTCRTIVRRDSIASTYWATCPSCDGDVFCKQVRGAQDETVTCDARCVNAVGASCDCSCGGENHGAAHAA